MIRTVATVLALGMVLAAPASAQTVREGRMKVVGRANVEVVPDQVFVRVGVSTVAMTPTAALDQNSASARKVVDFAKKFGIAERDIQTSSVNLAPRNKTIREANGNMRQEPDGYTANNTVRIKLGDVSRLGTFMRDVLDQGATDIGGVQFGVSDNEKYLDEVRADAVRDAVRQAQRLADAAKVRLGPINEITHPPRAEFHPVDGLADMPVRRLGSMRVPVEAGVIQISAEVSITWLIE